MADVERASTYGLLRGFRGHDHRPQFLQALGRGTFCAGAPAFSLSSLSWDYGTYTWHTNRDTFDKIVTDDLTNNATLVAILALLASEEPDRLPRERAIFPVGRDGQPGAWPTCRDGVRAA